MNAFPAAEVSDRSVPAKAFQDNANLFFSGELAAGKAFNVLDEPSLGLAPLVATELFEIIKRINQEQQTTILLVEQNAQLALSIASWGYIMENGQIVLDGSADEVRENKNVKEFYLGLNEKGERRSYREVKHYTRRKRWFSM